MKQVYDILTQVENHFNLDEDNINTVTFGALEKIDLNKTTMFPLAHFNISDIQYKGSVIELSINLVCLDIVDYNSNYDNSFAGATNLQDVLNTQSQVVNKLIDSFRSDKKHTFEGQFVLANEPSARLVSEEYENELSGWAVEIVVEVPNDISNC
tara:strand:+ start:1479 stop:1940 length:462 start_codon:yes stop_codon:yes gene_type:complete